MRKNLELKAFYPSVQTARGVCRRIGARPAGILRQVDTYFDAPEGRLKLREINRREFELIYYHRANVRGTRYSDFLVVPLRAAEPMKEVCARMFGVKTVVRKRRTLYLFRNARIHLDNVERLGIFIEFEVIVKRGRVQAKRLMDSLVENFSIEQKSIIGESYSDLLMRKR